MIVVSEYKNQAVGVFGLGKAGSAAVASLRVGGATVYAWDDKATESVSDDSRFNTCNYTSWPWPEIKALVLSPGVPLTHPAPHPVVALAKKHKVPILGDVELLYRACPKARYIGITGTNGKSTTTTLLGHILKSTGLKVEIGGNLGTPALALSSLSKDGIYVLEMSSYQLDLVRSTRFNVAVLLNLTPDHLDRHGSMDGYIAAKKHLFDCQQAGDTAVIAVDDDHTRDIVEHGAWLMERGIEVAPVSSQQVLERGVYVENGRLHDTFFTHQNPHAFYYDLSSIATLTGRHNWQNAAVAYAVAKYLGVSSEDIYRAMKSFAGLRHRLQMVSTIHGVRFINDSKATNAEATAHALAPFETIYWIAGGKPKDGGIESLALFFPKIAHAFLIGEAEEAFANTLHGKVSHTRCDTLKTAVAKASAMAFAEKKPGAVVLLSPACASFDQWKNFEERGDAFCEMVSELAAGDTRHAS